MLIVTADSLRDLIPVHYEAHGTQPTVCWLLLACWQACGLCCKGTLSALPRRLTAQTVSRQARALGLHNEPLVVAQLDAIAAETAALNQLAEQQQAGQPTPWWADGEYDAARAEAANDAGAWWESFKCADTSVTVALPRR